MNVPQIYLIEPYNAYAPKGRKKHWSEIVEEQALLERIIAEARNNSLPQNAPQVSTPTVGQAAQGQGQTGGGGLPLIAYFAPRFSVGITPSITTGSAPTTIIFSNNSSADLQTQGVATFLWTFGDGTTSSDLNPAPKNYTITGSLTGSFSSSFLVTLKATSIATGVTGSATASINMNTPTVTANFSLSSSLTASTATSITASITNSAAVNIAFINTTTTNNAQNSITYQWTFGSGSITSSLANPPLFAYTATGSYTVRLGATGSFGITSAANRVAVLIIT